MTSDLKNQFLRDRPYLMEIPNLNKFYGIYSHEHSVYRIQAKIPEFPSMRNCRVQIQKDLVDFAFEYDDSDDVFEFFTKFHLAVSRQPFGTVEVTVKDEAQRRENVLRQLKLLSSKQAFKIDVSADLSTIKVSFKNHYLNLSVANGMDVTILRHSLPECKVKWFNSAMGTIESYFKEFENILEQLEEFFSTLNTIDQLCFVVDPVVPTTKVNWRIFKIDKKCYIKVVIDPLMPTSITVTFIGPTSQVEQYRQKYELEINNWEPDWDVYKNLLKIFGLVYFPMKTNQNDDESSCSICGMYRMDDRIPMISCDNAKCDLVFHVVCLKQWFSMFADSKLFLHVELGATCPMCREKISTSYVQLL